MILFLSNSQKNCRIISYYNFHLKIIMILMYIIKKIYLRYFTIELSFEKENFKGKLDFILVIN